MGLVSTKEPFQRLVSQGMILGELEYTVSPNQPKDEFDEDFVDSLPEKLDENDVIKMGDNYCLKSDPSIRVTARSFKMSKSRGNVVNPDDIIGEFGADSLRLYEMFMGPLKDTKVRTAFGFLSS